MSRNLKTAEQQPAASLLEGFHTCSHMRIKQKEKEYTTLWAVKILFFFFFFLSRECIFLSRVSESCLLTNRKRNLPQAHIWNTEIYIFSIISTISRWPVPGSSICGSRTRFSKAKLQSHGVIFHRKRDWICAGVEASGRFCLEISPEETRRIIQTYRRRNAGYHGSDWTVHSGLQRYGVQRDISPPSSRSRSRTSEILEETDRKLSQLIYCLVLSSSLKM